MSLRERMEALEQAVHELRDAVLGLRLTVVEDEPSPSHAIATAFADAVEDMAGWLEEAAESVHAGVAALTTGTDHQLLWRSLEVSQELANRISQRLSEDLRAYDSLRQLSRLGRERGREWMSWSTAVRRGLDQCSALLHALNGALLACWKELAERSGSAWISVQATNVGQQITVPAGELARDGFT